MGSYSPVELPEGLIDQVMNQVIDPTLEQMNAEGTPFTGFLYAGLVLTAEGPRVLEFNVRLGDPETQAILPRLQSDLVDVLEGGTPTWSDVATVNVVLAAKGYPDAPEKGAVITGLKDIPDDVLVFHAGTAQDGRLRVSGGRVLSVVGTGVSVSDARGAAYDAIENLKWSGAQYRGDIAG